MSGPCCTLCCGARAPSTASFEALNEVVVSKGDIARMGDFAVELDGRSVARFRADGVIVSTPTGSTAYTLAANGPILTPDVDAMVVTPICPHLLTLRPIVVRGGASLTVRVEGVPNVALLTIDGQQGVELRRGDEVRCRRSSHTVKLVRLGESGFFDALRSKLSWGEIVVGRRRAPGPIASVRPAEPGPWQPACARRPHRLRPELPWPAFRNSRIWSAVFCSVSLSVRLMPFSPRSIAAMESSVCWRKLAGSPEESWPMALTAGFGIRGYLLRGGDLRGLAGLLCLDRRLDRLVVDPHVVDGFAGDQGLRRAAAQSTRVQWAGTGLER